VAVLGEGTGTRGTSGVVSRRTVVKGAAWSVPVIAAAAAVLLIYAIGFAFATAAAGLSEALPVWLSLLIVTGIIVLLAAIAAFLATRFAKKASPPKPSQAIEEAERTIETLQIHV